MTSSLVWFREDLRIADNPALRAAVAQKKPVLAVFVLDRARGGPRARGGAALWWLHHSLQNLEKNIAATGGKLHLFEGDAADVIPALAKSGSAGAAFWNRRYDKEGMAQDSVIESALTKLSCSVETFNSKLLVDSDALRTKSGTPFRVYTPFWRALVAQGDPKPPVAAPRRFVGANLPGHGPRPIALDELALLPRRPDWAGGLRKAWKPGETASTRRLHHFVDDILDRYATGRDTPADDLTSRLSPALATGEISARQFWHVAHHALEAKKVPAADVEKLSKELAWREFSYHLLFHNPDLATKNFNQKFDAFPWATESEGNLHAWQKGQTGYPIVDAGMRQLWETGWMHNRVRLITGSFLVKHLQIDWRKGEAWFWDTLCDADPANNAQNWQWIAGSGADAAPYFRIFNPVLQGQRFDPDGSYVKQFVPELRKMPARFIHRPWEASADVLAVAGLRLGKDYPAPIVDHNAARTRALAAFERVKG